MRLMKYLAAAALLLNSTVAVAQNTTPASTSLGSFRDRTGLDKPLQGVTVLDANGNPSGQGADAQPVATTPASAAVNVFSVDTTGYRGLTFSLYGTFTLGTQTECSNDNSFWVACAVLDTSTNNYTSGPNSTARAYYAPAVSRYFRLRVSSYTSGTLTAQAYLRQTNIDPGNITISGNPAVQGSAAAGNSPTLNPVRVGGVANSALPTQRTAGSMQDLWLGLNGQVVSAIGGGQAATSTSGTFFNFFGDSTNALRPLSVGLSLYDGSVNSATYLRSLNEATGTPGTGVLAVGNLGRDTSGTMRAFRVLPDGTQVVTDLDGQPVTVTPVTAAGVIFSTPTTGYAGVSFQTGSAANGGTWNFQGSNDSTDGVNGNWVSINAQQLNSSATSATQTASAGFFIPAVMTYVRVNVTGTLTSAVGGTAVLRSIAPLPTVIQNQTVNNNKMIYWNELVNGSVAVGGVVQNTRDTGVGNGGEYRYVNFTCQLVGGPTASSALSLSLQGSTDNSNWVNYVAPIPVTTANAYIQQTIRIGFRYNRCRLFNDTTGTATTGTTLNTQYGE